jgi:hypothetical protein
MTGVFPIEEIPLSPVPKRFLGLIPAQRAAAEIPPQRPGTVLVFNTGEKWVEARGPIRGTESFVVGAVAVSIVQTRPEEVNVRIDIPSAGLADKFTILSRFACRVMEPARVAEHGPIDVSGALANFLRKDRKLLTLGVSTEVADLQVLRDRVDARVRAWCDEAPPPIPGLEAELWSVELLTPEALLRHHEQMRDARLARELAVLLASHEDEDAHRLAERITQPEYLAALGVLRDKVDLTQLIADVYADRKTKDANILEFLKLLEKNGQLDRLPIDGRLLVQTLMTRLAGTPADGLPAGGDHALAIDTATLQQSIDSSAKRKEKRFAVDDDAD